MKSTHKLWNVIVTTTPALADAMAEACEDNARAITVLIPPRTAIARIEALFDFEPNLADLTARLAVVAALYETKPPNIEIQEAPKLDWVKKVAGDFPPLPIARWTIFGAHHRAAVKPSRYTLQIDATSAFGTGEHPTTRGCLLMLDWLLKKKHAGGDKSRLLDLGCGSGILAMAWVQATNGEAVAVDLDPDSVAISKHNARVNKLQDHIRFAVSRGYNSPLVKRYAPYDLIMANIFADPLCDLARDLRRHLRPGGTAILSGLLNRQANKVLAAHRMQGLRLVKHMIIGEWSVLALRHPASAK